MNIKKDIREKLNKYLDKKIAKGDPYIFNEVVNFIKKDRAEQLRLYSVVVPKGAFNCGKERAFGEERCKAQCKDCVIEYQDN
tara:strand:+ start:78 stop:323 length:246 start_codon:yes stop_codon:yes gene_type:complete